MITLTAPISEKAMKISEPISVAHLLVISQGCITHHVGIWGERVCLPHFRVQFEGYLMIAGGASANYILFPVMRTLLLHLGEMQVRSSRLEHMTSRQYSVVLHIGRGTKNNAGLFARRATQVYFGGKLRNRSVQVTNFAHFHFSLSVLKWFQRRN